jgi:hypothetical protein
MSLAESARGFIGYTTMLMPADYFRHRPLAHGSPRRPADSTVESNARRICGSCRRSANQCRRGSGVEQGRLF